MAGALEFDCAAGSDEGSLWLVPETNGLRLVIVGCDRP